MANERTRLIHKERYYGGLVLSGSLSLPPHQLKMDQTNYLSIMKEALKAKLEHTSKTNDKRFYHGRNLRGILRAPSESARPFSKPFVFPTSRIGSDIMPFVSTALLTYGATRGHDRRHDLTVERSNLVSFDSFLIIILSSSLQKRTPSTCRLDRFFSGRRKFEFVLVQTDSKSNRTVESKQKRREVLVVVL
jgi:hypothetical protein